MGMSTRGLHCSIYSRVRSRVISRAVSTQGWYLLKGNIYSRAVYVQSWQCLPKGSIQGWYPGHYLLKGDIHLRTVSRAVSMWCLFKGGICSWVKFVQVCIHSRAVSTQGWYLFEAVSTQGWYLFKAVSVQGWYLFKGGICARVVSVQGWYLFKGGIYWKQWLFKAVFIQVRNCSRAVYRK